MTWLTPVQLNLLDFEEALIVELTSIQDLNDKVFPLQGEEGTQAPYVFYISSEGIQDKSLEGYLNSKEVECEINILHDGYRNLKTMTRAVLSKILSFQGRVIGENGPFIHNVTYEKPVELYENEVSLYRSVIDIKFRL